MKLIATNVTQSSDGFHKLSGEVQYDDGTFDTYWFDVPECYELSESGNPWVACLLPLAVTMGEDLEIPLPVDPELAEGALGLTRLWKSWYPKLSTVAIKCEIAPIADAPTESMAFFSAGVDSYFTYLRHPVQYLVNVLGFDMPITNEAAFQVHCGRLAISAERLGATFIAVKTNIRQTRWRTCHWELLGSGAALATIGLVLEKRFARVMIPSSLDFGNLTAWGSHPLSDPLFSTSATRMQHDGAAYTRVEKIARIADNDVVQDTLHVCFRGQDGSGQDDTNCGRCEKCYRTMAVLHILGKLNDCALFDSAVFDVQRLSSVLIETPVDSAFYAEIEALALAYGRDDIISMIDAARRRSRWIVKSQILNRLPVLWRLGASISRRARRSSLT